MPARCLISLLISAATAQSFSFHPSGPDEDAQEKAKQVLRGSGWGEDEQFFAMHTNGASLVSQLDPASEGKCVLDVRDAETSSVVPGQEFGVIGKASTVRT